MKLDTPRPYRLKLKSEQHVRHLTEVKFQVVKEWVHDKHTKYLDLTDDKGDYDLTIEKYDVQALYKADTRGSGEDRQSICNYGYKHGSGEECVCYKKFKNMSGIRFFKILTEKLGYEYRYDEDITEEMQNAVKTWIEENNYDNTVGISKEEFLKKAEDMFMTIT